MAGKVCGEDPEDKEDDEMQRLCERLQKSLEEEEQGSVEEAMTMIRSYGVFQLSKRKFACRVVQETIARGTLKQQNEIAAGLKNHVLDAVNHLYANYVVQKFVQMCPVGVTSFIAEEMKLHAAQMARNRFGCRVILRLLEHAKGDATRKLVDAMLSIGESGGSNDDDDLAKLAKNEYAHHVISGILENGEPAQKSAVLRCLWGDLWKFAQNRRSSYVLECAVSTGLEFAEGSEDEAAQLRDNILARLVEPTFQVPMGDGDQQERLPLLLAMALDQFGCYVVKGLLQRLDSIADRAAEFLRPHVARLEAQNQKPGRRIVEAMQESGYITKVEKEEADAKPGAETLGTERR